jgi:hypothetical protein
MGLLGRQAGGAVGCLRDNRKVEGLLVVSLGVGQRDSMGGREVRKEVGRRVGMRSSWVACCITTYR